MFVSLRATLRAPFRPLTGRIGHATVTKSRNAAGAVWMKAHQIVPHL